MSCTRPNRMFDTGYKTKNGKPAYYFSNHYEKRDFIYKPISSDYVNSQDIKHVFTDKIIRDFIEVPCGECESCQADRAKEWAFKCCAEALCHEHNCVINLTYNDQNLPLIYDTNQITGEVDLTKQVPTLKYKDVQDFKKRLQRHFDYHYGEKGIRFVVAGEYGEIEKRPHYHIIAYNLHLRDLQYFFTTENGSDQYKSAEVQKLWNKGFVTIGDCDTSSIYYIANYTLKKIKGVGAPEHYRGRCPEFIVTSQKPPIGAKWMLDHIKDYQKYGKFVLGLNGDLLELYSSKTIDRLLEKINPEQLLKQKKAKKELNKMREEMRAQISGVSIDKLRQTKAKEFHERIKHAKNHRKFTQL